MNDTIRDEIARLGELRLPDLQARYAEVVGETTRCPNKRWLVRKIGEAMAQAETTTTTASKSADGEEPHGDGRPLRELSVAELQARHLAVVGRATGSSHVGYLRWRLRQAERGRIPVGPVRPTRQADDAAGFKVLPFRMKTGVVARLDEARARLGFGSRAELLRRALHDYLSGAGEREVASVLFADDVASPREERP